MRRSEMDSFNNEHGDHEDSTTNKKQNRSSLSCHVQHRRSKSASEKNPDKARNGVESAEKDLNLANIPQLTVKTRRQRSSPLHERPRSLSKNVSSHHRASLEKDIEQLQLRLQQEKSMRLMLERAMGRVSSTLSPGHRHFASQTRELIAEIELLEEEVANREQHVLSLYRNIFEHSVSRAPSEQHSSTNSPAHVKHVSRKHPSIISSAFCSSKSVPLQPLQSLISNDDQRKRTSRSSNAAALKTDTHLIRTCPGKVKFSQPEKGQVIEKNAAIRTLKDHLHQCPSKLSEEMVRCMAAVYCWLCSAESKTTGSKRSPFLSRSSTNVILPRRGIIDDRDGSCKSLIEISWISTDENQLSRASYAINNYRVLVEQLEKVNVKQMGSNAQVAFWINVYNALVMHAYLAYGIPHGSLRRLALFHKVAYNIHGHIISANAIEQSIFCFHTPRVGKWLEAIFSTALRKKSSEERQLISSKFGLSNTNPLACFALCTGALSDPMLKVYTAARVKDEIEAAKREFLQANVVVKKSKKVFLPRLLERFAKEASISSDDLLKWVSQNADKKLQDSIQRCMDRKSSKKPSQNIEWSPYCSRFRYVFAKEVTEKPWWV